MKVKWSMAQNSWLCTDWILRWTCLWLQVNLVLCTKVMMECIHGVCESASRICDFSPALTPLVLLSIEFICTYTMRYLVFCHFLCRLFFPFIWQVNYGNFMHGLMQENIRLNRKVLSKLSMHEPYSFKSLVDLARHAFPRNKYVVIPPRKVAF